MLFYTTTQALTESLGAVEIGAAGSYPKEGIDDNGRLTASVQIKLPWANRFSFLENIFANNVFYPRYPAALASPLTASVLPFAVIGADGYGVLPSEALVTINYGQAKSSNDNNGGGTDIFSESLEPHVEFITLPFSGFQWGSADKNGEAIKSDEAPGRPVYGFDYVQTRYRLPSIPTAILKPGVVNNSTVSASLLGISFPPETLLYQNSTPTRSITTDGTAYFTMPSRFSYREQGWNKFYRAKTGDWEQMYVKDGGVYRSFPSGNLSSILI